MLQHSLKLKAEAEAREKREKELREKEKTAASTSKSAENTSIEGEEPMDQDSGATSEEKKEGPEYSVGEDGRPRQHILTDTGMLIPAG